MPKRWLRYNPWLNYEDYFDNYYIKDHQKTFGNRLNRVQLLDFNRHNYDMVNAYTRQKVGNQQSCVNDPLFTQIPVLSAKRKSETIVGLPTGKDQNADRKYEDNMVSVLASMLYPYLDFAQEQSRTESGLHIRDIIFYNNRSYDFLTEIYDKYEATQLVIELKNVKTLERDHLNQLNRYLSDQFGRFGILFTRNAAPKNIYDNTINLWSAHRKCILILDDSDLVMMADMYENKQRDPIDVIKRKYIQFTRDCPS
ncbi:hypothetical protein [Chitinophaga sp. YR573]|uniref:hypothetical protein n=1 Tax=Chitinophaga sp. YR573 TaxID=1881040 RepID=UPI001C431EB2|nr:hypothetical protein [Chitinophaga sp. YR573]